MLSQAHVMPFAEVVLKKDPSVRGNVHRGTLLRDVLEEPTPPQGGTLNAQSCLDGKRVE